MTLSERKQSLLQKPQRLEYCSRKLTQIFPGSSMVEQEAVNFEVAGSSPAPGARPSREEARSSSMTHV